MCPLGSRLSIQIRCTVSNLYNDAMSRHQYCHYSTKNESAEAADQDHFLSKRQS